MKQTIASFVMGLVCAIAMSGASAVAQNVADRRGPGKTHRGGQEEAGRRNQAALQARFG